RWASEAVLDIDRRQAARKVVQVYARNADISGGFQSIGLRDSYVMIPAHAKPRLQNQGRAEGARVVRRRTDGFLCAGPAKAGAGVRAAIDAIGGGVEYMRLLEAETIRQRVLFVDVVVDLGIE